MNKSDIARMLAGLRKNRKGGTAGGRPKVCKDCGARMISDKEMATVLFSLRLFQSERLGVGEEGEFQDPYGYFQKHGALSDEKIDALCRRLNEGGQGRRDGQGSEAEQEEQQA